MAISRFPFEFSTFNGKKVMVDIGRSPAGERASFDFALSDSNGVLEQFSWMPLSEHYRDTTIRKDKSWSKDRYAAIQGFWAIYND